MNKVHCVTHMGSRKCTTYGINEILGLLLVDRDIGSWSFSFSRQIPGNKTVSNEQTQPYES
jgi:hypothetical protein